MPFHVVGSSHQDKMSKRELIHTPSFTTVLYSEPSEPIDSCFLEGKLAMKELAVCQHSSSQEMVRVILEL